MGDNLNKKVDVLYDKNIRLIISDEYIDLRKDNNKLSGRYYIYLHKTNLIIGTIEYRSYHFSEYVGDISYGVMEEFRGHNYALRALNLLSEHLFKNGVSDFWITAHKSNIASIGTVLKYGVNGTILERKEQDNIIFFDCKTKLRLEEDYSINHQKH